MEDLKTGKLLKLAWRLENGRGSTQITRFVSEGIKPTGKMTCFEGYSTKWVLLCHLQYGCSIANLNQESIQWLWNCTIRCAFG